MLSLVNYIAGTFITVETKVEDNRELFYCIYLNDNIKRPKRMIRAILLTAEEQNIFGVAKYLKKKNTHNFGKRKFWFFIELN